MRFRLRSYVCAMLLLAGVLGANLTPVTYVLRFTSTGSPDGIETHFTQQSEYGWPCSALWAETSEAYLLREYLALPEPRRSSWWGPMRFWNWRALALNIAIGLAIPIAALFACEFVLRRWGREPEVACRYPGAREIKPPRAQPLFG